MKEQKYSLLRPFLLMVLFWLITIITITITQGRAGAVGEFVTTWRTNVNHVADTTLTIPTDSGSTYNYTVDWGDGAVDSNVTGDAHHTYATIGTYTVSISGQFPHLYLNGGEQAVKLASIESWGSIEWGSMRNAFAGATYSYMNATDVPDLSNVTDVSNMFSRNVYWDADVSTWDVSNVEDFSYMFREVTRFNSPVNGWNVSSATDMEGMFRGASRFNQPISSWDVTNVRSMTYMFADAFSFNQDISMWRIPNVISTEFMFYRSYDFNQDLSRWDVDSLRRAAFMFHQTSMSSGNYDALLIGWSQDDVESGVSLTHIDTTFCNGVNSRRFLISIKRWDVGDGGVDGALCAPSDITFDSPGGLTITAGQDTVGLFGTTDADGNDTFAYSLSCVDGQYPDSRFFEFVGNELITKSEYDFGLPLDHDRDRVFDICVVSRDSTGFAIEKEFSITVTGTTDFVVDDGAVLGDSTDTPSTSGDGSDSGSSDGANSDGSDSTVNGADDGSGDAASNNSSTNTTNQPQVLAAGDVAGDGSTLASTGFAATKIVFVGLFIVGAAYGLLYAGRYVTGYRLNR